MGNAPKRVRENRFIGNGNTSVGGNLHHRGWQITCSRCGKKSKTISSHRGSGLPPHALIKKFSQSGWNVGSNAQDDLCQECQRKPAKPQSNIDFAKKTLAGALTQPMTTVNGHRIHYSEIVSVAKTLDTDQVQSLIKTLREQLPQKPQRKVKAPKPLPELEADYRKWLEED